MKESLKQGELCNYTLKGRDASFFPTFFFLDEMPWKNCSYGYLDKWFTFTFCMHCFSLTCHLKIVFRIELINPCEKQCIYLFAVFELGLFSIVKVLQRLNRLNVFNRIKVMEITPFFSSNTSLIYLMIFDIEILVIGLWRSTIKRCEICAVLLCFPPIHFCFERMSYCTFGQNNLSSF